MKAAVKAAAAAALVVACGGLGACGAPESRRAEGPAGREVAAVLARAEADAAGAAGDAAEAGAAGAAAEAGGFDHAAWTRLLAGGTREGLVDYGWFRRHRAELEAYLDRVAGAELTNLAPRELEALLINAYNAYTVLAILRHPGVSSIRDIEGVWDERTHPVGGHSLTLDQIEHGLLRPYFRDPRLHFALNCASRSCAPLPPRAFTGARLDSQLEARTRAFLSDPENVRVEEGTLLLSRYFDWYGEDFTAEDWTPRAGSISLFVAEYTRAPVADFIRGAGGDPPIRFLDYDWSLNAADGPARRAGGSPDAGSPAAGGGADAVDAPDAVDAVDAPDAVDAVDAADRAAARQGATGWAARFRSWVDRLGPAAPVAYAAGYTLATVLLLPGSALSLGAGAAFGLLAGVVVVWAGAVAGAALAFLLARSVLRGRVQRRLAGSPKFEAIDRAVGREGWKIVGLTRLSPVFPFNLQNYAYGLTAVGFWPYLWTTAVGILPGTLLYVYLGAAGVEVASALTTGATDWGSTALKVLGLAATLAVVIFIAHIARRALRDVAETANPAGGSGTGTAGGSGPGTAGGSGTEDARAV